MEKMILEGIHDDGFDESDFHNPLFSSNSSTTTSSGSSSKGTKVFFQDKSRFPVDFSSSSSSEDGNNKKSRADASSSSSGLVMLRHGKKDGRNDRSGALMDITRGRVNRPKKTANERCLKRLSSLDMPSCVVVEQGDASDAGAVLQHCAFRMEAFRVNKQARGSTTFLFVFHSGKPNQVALEITHITTGALARRGPSRILGKFTSSPSNQQGRIKMTLGGKDVLHMPGEPYSCYIHQVGTVTFNPRKQAKGYLYILSQEGRTLFTSLN